jgi:putative DNA primase/helicase
MPNEINQDDGSWEGTILDECVGLSLAETTGLLADAMDEEWLPYAKALAAQHEISVTDLKTLVHKRGVDRRQAAKALQQEAARQKADERKTKINAENAAKNALRSQGKLIVCETGKLHETVDAAEKAMRESAEEIYIRSGNLVKISRMDYVDSSECKVAVPAIMEVTVPEIQRILARATRWEKYDKYGKLVPCDVPEIVAKNIFDSDGCGRQVVKSVRSTPYLRRNGEIVTTSGINESTGIYLDEPLILPEIPEQPTKSDAKKSLAVLDGLLKEFPWREGASSSVGLSLMLTMVARPAMPVVPMHIVSAPAAGSGKSYFVDLASQLAHGHNCPVISAGKNDEVEQEKRISSMMMTGAPVFSIDNVNGELRGDFLCQSITQHVVNPRVLGKSECAQIVNTATICATGNNIVIHGDLTRRTLVAVLDSQREHPEGREFDSDPMQLIRQDRGKYVAAALTILRAHIVAGCPGENGIRPLASFEDWSRIVRGALVWLGRADPCAEMGRVSEDDPDRAHQSQLQSALIGLGVHGEANAKTLAEIARMRDPLIEDDGDTLMYRQHLTEALEPFTKFGNVVNMRALGKRMLAFSGRIVGKSTVRSKMGHATTKRWWAAPTKTT